MVYLVIYDELDAPRGCCLRMAARADMESAPTNQKESGKTIRLPGRRGRRKTIEVHTSCYNTEK